MKKISFSILMVAGLTAISSCKKDGDPISAVNTELNAKIINDFSVNIATAEYVSLAEKTSLLYDQAVALGADKTEAKLSACRQTWRDARKVWEQSEAQLFGPVETDNIDPHIDSWPVDFNALNDQLSSNSQFTEAYINNLDDALKGFHPIEYILFGTTGTRTAASLTDREIQYLTALSLNVKVLTTNLKAVWDSSISSSFFSSFANAGNGSDIYTTQQAALEQLVSAMADICGEVANSKMKEPFDAKNAALEESPFAQSSMTDFKNNITGIKNVYLGKFLVDGTGLEDLVKTYQLSLDEEIKLKLSTALNAMDNVTDPFGTAITSQSVQVKNAMEAINDLKSTIEDKLYPFVVQHSK
jgi:putative iron-regulated protein